MRDEAERILRHLRPDDRVWLLERTGTQLSSEALAARLDDVAHDGASRLTFVVAGTYGADDRAARTRRIALVALAS